MQLGWGGRSGWGLGWGGVGLAGKRAVGGLEREGWGWGLEWVSFNRHVYIYVAHVPFTDHHNGYMTIET